MCPVGGATPMVHGPCLLTTQPFLFLLVFSRGSAQRVEAAQPCVRRGRTGSRRLVDLLVGGGLRQPPSIPPPPISTHRRRTAPPTLRPTSQIIRRNRREGQWSLSANDARPWYDEAPKSPLWASYMRRANEAAREMCALSVW
ncbi:hypothetical protein TcCL_NonESM10981 [Trypanosoma cruzi]|nr:hypothetical protein TcCL_NonESM10981 [Trypanosoma cruzi]